MMKSKAKADGVVIQEDGVMKSKAKAAAGGGEVAVPNLLKRRLEESDGSLRDRERTNREGEKNRSRGFAEYLEAAGLFSK